MVVTVIPCVGALDIRKPDSEPILDGAAAVVARVVEVQRLGQRGQTDFLGLGGFLVRSIDRIRRICGSAAGCELGENKQCCDE